MHAKQAVEAGGTELASNGWVLSREEGKFQSERRDMRRYCES